MVDLLTILQTLDLIGTEINFQTSNNSCHIIVIFPFFKPPENMLVEWQRKIAKNSKEKNVPVSAMQTFKSIKAISLWCFSYLYCVIFQVMG